jgi:hypothetical protein
MGMTRSGYVLGVGRVGGSKKIVCPGFDPPNRTMEEFDRGLGMYFCERLAAWTTSTTVVCTENLIRVDDAMESPKLAE